MKQTAVEWLAEQITTLKWKMSDISDRNSIIEQAKQMEKEQIMEAYRIGYINYLPTTNSEEYYNETFKSE